MHYKIQSDLVVTTNDTTEYSGAQWLSGRVLDSRPRAAGSSLTGSLCCVLEQEH